MNTSLGTGDTGRVRLQDGLSKTSASEAYLITFTDPLTFPETKELEFLRSKSSKWSSPVSYNINLQFFNCLKNIDVRSLTFKINLRWLWPLLSAKTWQLPLMKRDWRFRSGKNSAVGLTVKQNGWNVVTGVYGIQIMASNLGLTLLLQEGLPTFKSKRI